VHRQAAARVDERPAHDVALEKLRALAGGPELAADDRRPFYFAHTEIVREYLGRRYGLTTLELTTRELLDALERVDLGPGRDALAAWLEACDLVKYAGARATEEEAQAALAQAVDLVERTRPQVTVVPGAGGAPPPVAEGRQHAG
jgi:hypothetical protein